MHQIKPRLLPFVGSCALFAVVFVGITSPSWQTLWFLWTEKGSGYSHGPLVLGVCFWLVYDRWGQLHYKNTDQPWQRLFALCIGLGASLVWSMGHLTSTGLFQWVSLPVMAGGIITAGSRARIRLGILAPFIAAYFALPVWELLVPGLQSLAVMAVSTTVSVLKIPAYIEGINVTIPGGKFVVEGGCSGVRYLLVSIALTSLWSFLHVQRTSYSICLILFGVVLSILSNWLRIFLIVYIGYKTNMQSSLVYDHEFFGWILFALTLIPILALALWMERQPRSTAPTPPVEPQWHRSWLLGACILIALPALAAQLLQASIAPKPSPKLVKQLELNQQKAALHPVRAGSKKPIFGGWKPEFEGVSQWQEYTYIPSNIEILIGHIPKQSRTHELLSSQNSFHSKHISTQWQETQQGQFLALTNIYNQRWLTRVYYRVGGEITTGGIKGKISQLNAVMNGRNDAQLIVIGARCKANCEEELAPLTPAKIETLFQSLPE